MIERTPAGRVGVVEDVAPAAVFLASDAARYVARRVAARGRRLGGLTIARLVHRRRAAAALVSSRDLLAGTGDVEGRSAWRSPSRSA